MGLWPQCTPNASNSCARAFRSLCFGTCCRYLGRAYKSQHAANALFGCKLEQDKQVEHVAWHCCRSTSSSFRVLVILKMMMRRRRIVMVMMKMIFGLQWTPPALFMLPRTRLKRRPRKRRPTTRWRRRRQWQCICRLTLIIWHSVVFWGGKGCYGADVSVWPVCGQNPSEFRLKSFNRLSHELCCNSTLAKDVLQTDQPNMQVFQLFWQSKIPNSSCQSRALFVLYIVFLDRQVMRLLPPGPPDVAIIHNWAHAVCIPVHCHGPHRRWGWTCLPVTPQLARPSEGCSVFGCHLTAMTLQDLVVW